MRRALTSSRLRAVVPTRGPVRSAAISPDDSRVLTVDGLGTAHVRSATGGGGDIASFGAGLVNDAAFDPTGRLIVTASKDGTARIVDASRGEERLVIRAGSAPVVAARFSRDGRRVLTVSRDGVARTFDARTGKRGADARVRSPLRGTSSARAARQSSSSGKEATRACGAGSRASRRGAVFLGRVAVADDGRVALAGGIGLTPGDATRRRHGGAGDRRFTYRRSEDDLRPRRGSAASPSAPAAGSSRPRGPETARIWDTLPGRFGRALPVLRGHAGEISDVAFAPDGETVLTASDDGSARLWRAATGEQLAVFRSPTAPTRALFSPSGKRIVTTRRGDVRVWAVDAVPAQFARRLPPVYPNPPIAAITFTRDGSHLVAAGSGAWTLETGSGRIQRAFYPTALPGSIFSVSPDGRLVAYGRGVQEAVTGRWRWRDAAVERDVQQGFGPAGVR